MDVQKDMWDRTHSTGCHVGPNHMQTVQGLAQDKILLTTRVSNPGWSFRVMNKERSCLAWSPLYSRLLVQHLENGTHWVE